MLVDLEYGPTDNEGFVFARNIFDEIGLVCGDTWDLNAVSSFAIRFSFGHWNVTACLFDFRLYLTPLVQARLFIEACGT